MYRYIKAIAAMAFSAALFLASRPCVYANNDYLAYTNPETEMEATTSTTVTVDYVGNFVYENGTLTKILFEGGYVDMTGSTPKYMYYLTDRLGNVRVVADSEGNIAQVNHYYPYGDRFSDNRYALSSSSTSNNDHLFGGKELDSSSGLYDFEARYDNTRFGRFTTIDTMAEKYYGVSPYVYGSANPVNMIDPNGMASNPVYSHDGFYRGNTNEGFTGEVIIYDGEMDFSQLSAAELLYDDSFDLLTQRGTANTYDNFRNLLSSKAKSRIWTHIVSQMEGERIYDEVFSLSTLSNGIIDYSDTDNGSWNSRIDAKTITGTDKYSYETTVENIQSSVIVHEWYSHIKKGNSDKLKSHRLAYKNVINYKPLWDKTTDNYKAFNLKQLQYYTTKETNRKFVDIPYRNLYNRYVNQ